ncbi:response regulator [Aureimonas sp. ME7]|uniref:response regulator n=1 Tax=Aureimonas sp. ME7 TaxID=2744252 RepID=UPI0015F4C6CA|nr:response regulator [Aureimonas sp. ME7]
MRILILEDEPLIAMDLEDIVTDAVAADCVWAKDLRDGMRRVTEGIDFALLDFDLGGDNSLPVASYLRAHDIPFCFVSSSLSKLPPQFHNVPSVSKPFRPADILRAIPST